MNIYFKILNFVKKINMKKKYVSVKEYASRCVGFNGKMGISVQAVYKRHEMGQIVLEHLDKGLYIDIDKYPPLPRKKAGRTKLDKEIIIDYR